MNGAECDEASRRRDGKTPAFGYRRFTAASLRQGKDALSAKWIGVTVADAKGKVTYIAARLAAL